MKLNMSLLQREVTTEKERQLKKKKKTSTETSIKIDKYTGALVSVYSFYDSAGCL